MLTNNLYYLLTIRPTLTNASSLENNDKQLKYWQLNWYFSSVETPLSFRINFINVIIVSGNLR